MYTLIVAALLAAGPAAAQTHDPHTAWRTVETDHFRVVYPLDAEPWALHAAERLDAARERVSEAVGYAPPQIVTVVVMDPFRQANGFALPFVRQPRMGLFATPPGASSIIGNYRSWAEELTVHEDAHLVHLLRPSRHGGFRFLTSGLLGVTPMTLSSPPWVFEGYATVIEGRLTGAGRPNSDARAVLLRRLAQEGRLPTYGQLDGSERWLAGSFRYLVGSAYLEWLEARTGEGSMVALWRRMTARQVRTFDEAFVGVYGDSPSALYARFTAELVHAALTLETQRPADAGTLWLDLSWTTGNPALSPDGNRLAVVVRSRKSPAKLTVYDTADDPEVESTHRERISEMLARDPEDVAPVDPDSWPRTPVAIRTRDARSPVAPRWTPDGTEILFVTWLVDGDGWFRPDLFAWSPDTGGERRITHGADITAIDPHPDGTWGVGIRTFWGSQHLVRVDLATGAWSPITAPDPTVVVDDPRFHPDGDRFVYLRHDGLWRVVVRHASTGEEQVVPLPEGLQVTDPAWSADGTELLVSAGSGGFVELYALPLGGGDPRQLTHALGGAGSPEPTPDGEAVFYLSLDSDGLDIHRLAFAEVLPTTDPPGSALPVVRPPPPAPVDPPQREDVVARPYGAGRQELGVLGGVGLNGSSVSLEGGVRLGDVAGRTELLALGAWNPRLPGRAGAALVWAWRRLAFDVNLHGFLVHDSERADFSRAGGALTLSVDHAWNRGGAGVRLGALFDAPALGDTEASRVFAFGSGSVQVRADRGVSWASAQGRADGLAGATGTERWGTGRLEVTLAAGLEPVGLTATWAGGTTTATGRWDRFRLGGMDSSIVPEAWLWTRVLDPALPAGTDTGAATDSLRGAVSLGELDLFVTHHRLSDRCDGVLACSTPSRTTVAGAEVTLEAPSAPLVKTPAGTVRMGAACRLQDPVRGVPDKPCTHWSDYTAWLGLTWRP